MATYRIKVEVIVEVWPPEFDPSSELTGHYGDVGKLTYTFDPNEVCESIGKVLAKKLKEEK